MAINSTQINSRAQAVIDGETGAGSEIK